MWKLKVDWDNIIPKNILQRYQQCLSKLHHIKEFSISRWFSVNVGKKSDIELHIYLDASNSACAAVAYFKSIASNKSVFVLGKSRLSPIKEKTLTNPCVELQAAVTAMRLKDKIVEKFDIQFVSIKVCVDSQIVLKYIQNTNSNFPIFVINCLNEI